MAKKNPAGAVVGVARGEHRSPVTLKAVLPFDCEIVADGEDARICKVLAAGRDITDLVKQDSQFEAWFAAELAAANAIASRSDPDEGNKR